jgi:hypothetical protein
MLVRAHEWRSARRRRYGLAKAIFRRFEPRRIRTGEPQDVATQHPLADQIAADVGAEERRRPLVSRQ